MRLNLGMLKGNNLNVEGTIHITGNALRMLEKKLEIYCTYEGNGREICPTAFHGK